MALKDFRVKNGLTTPTLTVDGISNLGPIGNVTITGGSNGQIVTTDGSGNLSFGDLSSSISPMPTLIATGVDETIPENYQGLFGYPITIDGSLTVDGILVDVSGGGGNGYSNSDVDLHLNTNTASNNEVLSWNGSDYIWVAQSGTQGETGPAGPQGIQGEVGPQGETGPAGPQGIQGEVGPAGASGSANTFGTIAITGQSSIVANSATDTITFEAGTGIAISANTITDTVTISATSAESLWTNTTASTTLVAGQKALVDTSVSAVTLTLPASPTLGEEVRIIDATGNCATNNITVARNGSNIMGLAEDFIINIDDAAFGLVYFNASRGWVLTEK